MVVQVAMPTIAVGCWECDTFSSACHYTITVAGAEAVQPASMGVFTVSSITPTSDHGSRPIYEDTNGMHLYYWAASGNWNIDNNGGHTNHRAWVYASSTASCPTEATGWYAWSGSAYLSYGITVIGSSTEVSTTFPPLVSTTFPSLVATAFPPLGSTPAPTPASAYINLGEGKCRSSDGHEPAYTYHDGVGDRCQGFCDDDAECGGYSASMYNNCIMWMEYGLTGGGDA